MTKDKKALLALLAGSAIGLTLGILFAPNKGNETRRKISNSANKSLGIIKGKINEQIANLHNLRERVFQSENNGQL